MASLTGDRLNALRRAASSEDKTLTRAFEYIFDERKMAADDFAPRVAGRFRPEKVVNVNNPKDLENRQIELNALRTATMRYG